MQRVAVPTPDVRPGFAVEPTPSIGGYLFAAAVADVIGSVLIAMIVLAVTENTWTVPNFLTTAGIVGVVATSAALILGFPLTALAHFRLRSVRRQWIHVVAFAVVGAVVGGLTAAVVLNGIYTTGVMALMAGATAVASAVGRLSVSGPRSRYMISE